MKGNKVFKEKANSYPLVWCD